MIRPLSLYRRRKHGFPKQVRRHWLAGDYWKRSDEDKEDPEEALDYYDEEGNYIDYSKGDEVVLYEEDGFEAVYEITKVRNPRGDTLAWDDNRKYDFKFKKVRRK